VSDLFIKDAAERKRNESREAYEFIDKQVKSYKQQLQDAEEALKAFKSESIDGSESSVKARIAQLRGQIENIKLDIDEGNIRVSTIESELKSEAKFLDKQFKTDVYQERLRLVRQRLATLRLTYTDTHPDVQALQHQIDEMKNAIKNPGSASPSEDSYKAESKKADSAGNINPLYEELRSKLSDAKVEIESKKRRLSITEGLLEKEYDRLKLAAAGQAEEAELKRDYSVTKSIYEDMLERKEKARLSMTLDIEGQGMSYKVQEPANYPVSPVGLKFMHFALIGPILGLLIPLGLIVVYVVLDPRIRFSSALLGLDGVVVLASVPHVLTPIKKRIFSWDVILLGLFILVTGSIYLAVTYARVKGML
jgi:polysaccharide chain length determinant protein (PEP-CTERM system associated)